MTAATWTRALLAVAALCLASCADPDPDAPPTIVYGESVCADCDMIINDARFASALIAEDDRGRAVTLLFDDIGDQLRLERERPGLKVLARWTHDHGASEWIRAESAYFMRSERFHTPMASGIAAFAQRADAESLAEREQGVVLTFEQLRAATASTQGAQP